MLCDNIKLKCDFSVPPFQALARHQQSDAIEGNWREIMIPVDVPQVQVREPRFSDDVVVHLHS